MREQIAPFDVDFTVKEISLDFSKMKSAAYGLWSKSGKMFSLSSNNAVLEFLLEVTGFDLCLLMFLLHKFVNAFGLLAPHPAPSVGAGDFPLGFFLL